MAANRKVGVSDVAKHAGVSIGTVSNYLNYPERVSATLKERIGAAIAELGYTPKHAAARAGTAGGARLVGFVMTDIEHSLFTSIFEGAQEVCEDNDMQIVGMNAFSDLERQHELVATLIGMKVAGILLSTVLDPARDVAAAKAAGVPIVLVDHTNASGHEPTCAVVENNISAGRLAAEELIREGSRHLAFAAHSFDYEQVQDRQLGVQKAVMNAGEGVTFELVNTGGLMDDDGYQLGLALSDQAERQRWSRYDADGDADGDDMAAPSPTSDREGRHASPAMERVMRELNRIPDGVVACSDKLAVGLMRALNERGVLRVPEDIAVIGTEGVNLPLDAVMPLSVTQAPGMDMGRKAMEQLLDHIENPASHVHGTIMIEPTLIRRASTRA